MPLNTSPRSVRDATRFTAATPHADSKLAEPRFSRPSAAVGAATAPGSGSGSGSGPRLTRETPEERVARLRAIHQRATAARVSRLDMIIDRGRRFFDSAHKVTVMGMIGFTVLAGMATVYTAVDMISYNRKRKAEFFEAQKKLEADSLEAARIAYMTGKATEEQIALVEEAMERENAVGGSLFAKLPSALSVSKPGGPPPDQDRQQPKGISEAAKWPASAATASSSSSSTVERGVEPGTEEEEEKQEKKNKMGLWAWMTSSLKREEEGDDAMSSERRLGYESLSEEDDATGVRDSDLVRAVEDKEAYIRQKAHEAFEKEKKNQRTGGPLDRVGLEEGTTMDKEEEKPAKKRGWW
ncbi:cytochrome oxidase c assembly-domain-containing protein [Echria macrotheca]|uniref:Cytochrome oxidase c assembly-domain-containing protein n=1 Tax=Echria macrotheca TaxID=438768 RepID=A0AAJ0F453_9PEZI|nr:cytochrome oxidase c assembly-domain-containing protein [Echria macrotheca]